VFRIGSFGRTGLTHCAIERRLLQSTGHRHSNGAGAIAVAWSARIMRRQTICGGSAASDPADRDGSPLFRKCQYLAEDSTKADTLA